jgi:hypothetical protein
MPPFRAISRGIRCLCVSDLVANTPLRPFVSGTNFWRLVLRELYSGSRDAERGPLVGPIKRYALASHEVGDAEGFRRWSMNATQCASAHKIAVNCQPMSALGQKRTFALQQTMSALPPNAPAREQRDQRQAFGQRDVSVGLDGSQKMLKLWAVAAVIYVSVE